LSLVARPGFVRAVDFDRIADPYPPTEKERAMAKGQQKGNREAKKPKADKKVAVAAVDPRNQLTHKIANLKVGGKNSTN